LTRLSSCAGLSLKWLKMVFIPFLGFWGSFEAHVLLTLTSMLWSSNRARCSLNVSWENPTSRSICRSFHDLPSLKTAEICLSNKLKLNPKRQNKNKDHFTPISGQASALTMPRWSNTVEMLLRKGAKAYKSSSTRSCQVFGEVESMSRFGDG